MISSSWSVKTLSHCICMELHLPKDQDSIFSELWRCDAHTSVISSSMKPVSTRGIRNQGAAAYHGVDTAGTVSDALWRYPAAPNSNKNLRFGLKWIRALLPESYKAALGFQSSNGALRSSARTSRNRGGLQLRSYIGKHSFTSIKVTPIPPIRPIPDLTRSADANY